MKHKKLTFKPDLESKKFKNSIEDRKFTTSMDARYEEDTSYKIAEKNQQSRVTTLLHDLKSKQDMVILHEILGLPKSMQ